MHVSYRYFTRPDRACFLRYIETVEQRAGRVLALDLGKKRIGLAISDELGITAQGIPTLQRTNLREDLARISEIIRERNISLLLMGKPVHMTGREGRQAVYTREFADRLHNATGVPVEFWDERYTTVIAQRVLRDSGISIEKRARAVDQLAATILLESYLDACALRREDEEYARGEVQGGDSAE